MANTQINVSTNGTTTLATAGKYCDRNIDVNVNVSGGGEQPTQFTNLYDPAYVTIDNRMSASSSSGVTYTADTECNSIKIPYHHVANTPVVLRIRGLASVRSRLHIAMLGSDGTTLVANGQLYGLFSLEYDKHGDIMLTATGATSIAAEWHYLEFNFQYFGQSSANEALPGPIITINEPIGNGGATA